MESFNQESDLIQNPDKTSFQVDGIASVSWRPKSMQGDSTLDETSPSFSCIFVFLYLCICDFVYLSVFDTRKYTWSGWGTSVN